MTAALDKTVFGLSPAAWGAVSLSAAVLAWASWPLMVVVGFAVLYVDVLLLLVTVVAGLLGVGGGIYYKHAPAIVMGTLGLLLISVGAGSLFHALTHF